MKQVLPVVVFVVLVFVTVGEVDPEGVKGTTGAPAGSTAAKKYPEGLNTKSE